MSLPDHERAFDAHCVDKQVPHQFVLEGKNVQQGGEAGIRKSVRKIEIAGIGGQIDGGSLSPHVVDDAQKAMTIFFGSDNVAICGIAQHTFRQSCKSCIANFDIAADRSNLRHCIQLLKVFFR